MMNAELLQLAALFGTGFLLGLKHALDADHVAAVSAMVSETKSVTRSSILGVFWGMGHTSALLLAGFLILVFKLEIPEQLALSFELLVGIMLVLLGANVLWKAAREKIHVHAHEHDGSAHIHFHSHRASPSHRHIHTSNYTMLKNLFFDLVEKINFCFKIVLGSRQARTITVLSNSRVHQSFAVGILHGLAGSAVVALLALTAAPSVLQGLIFILVFGAGSILGMMMVSAVIGLPFALASKFEKAQLFVKTSAGLASIVLGMVMIYEIGGRVIF